MNAKLYDNKQNAAIISEAAIRYDSYPNLRGLSVGNDYSLIKKAHKGVGTDVFYSLADAIKMPEKKLAAIINLSPRNISNYRDQQKRLDANYSEHLLKLANMYRYGADIFGSFEEFNLWLHRPFWASDDTPMDFLTTSGGVDLVLEEMEKLALGYPV
jgi:putative toxin-antitoxin system antitoxin component (TIGR02293 family)